MNISTRLNQLKNNQIATIIEIETDTNNQMLKTRLEAMGLTKGNTVKILRKFWWSGPLQVKVGTTTIIAIRRKEASLIMVSQK